MPDFTTYQDETISERGVRLLRECREELAAMPDVAPATNQTACPTCGAECVKFTGRHSGKVFISHPESTTCRYSDAMLGEEEFSTIITT